MRRGYRRTRIGKRAVVNETAELVTGVMNKAAAARRSYTTYKHYLASREWALRKQAVQLVSEGRCERCHLREARATSVHHLNYDRIFREDLEDLEHVCDGCHAYLSARSDQDPLLRFYYDVESCGTRLCMTLAAATCRKMAALADGTPDPWDPERTFGQRLDDYFDDRPLLTAAFDTLREFRAWSTEHARYYNLPLTPRDTDDRPTLYDAFLFDRAVLKWRKHREPYRMPALLAVDEPRTILALPPLGREE